MKHDDLPQRWKDRVKEWLASHGEMKRDRLNAYDFFPNVVARILFDDGSKAEFYYPIVIEAPEWGEVGVFTEHCGYHIFEMAGTHVCIEEDDE